MLHGGAIEVTEREVPPARTRWIPGGDALPHNVWSVFVGRIGQCYRPCPMAAKTAFTKKELDDLRERLLEEKEQLQVQLSTIEEATFATSQSDISGEVSFDDENADAGTFTFERERDLSIENNVRDLLRKIDRALSRMDDGTYGICARCGKPIEKARLKALPYADLCIKDAQAQARSR